MSSGAAVDGGFSWTKVANKVADKLSPKRGGEPRQQSGQQQQQEQAAEVDVLYRYNMSHKKRGQCVIINNVNFDPKTGKEERKGSDHDADITKALFERLGFDVQIERNQKASDILKIARNVAENEHAEADCFAMVILSHGEEFGEVWGVDDKVLLEDIFFCIKQCQTLIGKPKLFFIQACEKELDEEFKLPAEYETDSEHGSIQKPTQKIPIEADFFYAYSTPPGSLSFRSAKGAWFIQAINSVFTKHAGTMELMQMMTRVNHMVAYQFTDSCRGHERKQVPLAVTMLTKELYFTSKPQQSPSV